MRKTLFSLCLTISSSSVSCVAASETLFICITFLAGDGAGNVPASTGNREKGGEDLSE